MPTMIRRRSSRASGYVRIASSSSSSARRWSPASSAAKRLGEVDVLGALEADPGGERLGREVAGNVLEHLERLGVLAAVVQEARQAHRGAGVGGLELDRAAQVLLAAGVGELLCLGGHEAVEEALDGRGRLRADELVDDASVAERLDGRDALDPEGLADARVGVGVELREHDLALALVGRLLERRCQHAAGAAPFGPEVHDHGKLARALDDLLLEVLLGDVDDHAHSDYDTGRPGPVTELTVEHAGVRLSGDEDGDRAGMPIALLHGLTATRRYVVMGSKALPRAGFRVIAYDARGHGSSDPAPEPSAYEYADLVGDLVAVLDERGVERAVLAGASMGAHTILRFALEHPERTAALVVITPAYDPTELDDPERMSRWAALARGLREGGIDAFVEAYGNGGVGVQWHDTVQRVLRQRLAQHRNLDALADALDVTPLSRPFGRIEDLAAIEAPTIVVASNDAADPGHPFAIGQAYAAAIPRARLVTEEPGKSPIAWQGGQLSRIIEEAAALG